MVGYNDPDLKVEETGSALVVTAMSDRAYVWLLKTYPNAPRFPGKVFHLRPDGLEQFLAEKPKDYRVWR